MHRKLGTHCKPGWEGESVVCSPPGREVPLKAAVERAKKERAMVQAGERVCEGEELGRWGVEVLGLRMVV